MVELQNVEKSLVTGLGFILGTVLGSFIKVWADRSLEGKKFGGRSYCEHCKKQIRWHDLFPIVSYLLLGGKCRFCKKKIGIEYLATEVLTGLIFGLLFFQTFIFTDFFVKDTIGKALILDDLVVKGFAISVFITVFITDIKKGLIPDKITYPSIATLFFVLIIVSIAKITLIYISLKDHPIGKFLLPPHSDYFLRHSLLAAEPLTSGIIAAASLGLFFGLIIFITKGKGMGGGDLKLAIFMGLALGIASSIVALMVAFISGSLVGIILVALKNKKINQTIPFGPFLSIGGVIALLWGKAILDWYLKLSSFS